MALVRFPRSELSTKSAILQRLLEALDGKRTERFYLAYFRNLPYGSAWESLSFRKGARKLRVSLEGRFALIWIVEKHNIVLYGSWCVIFLHETFVVYTQFNQIICFFSVLPWELDNQKLDFFFLRRSCLWIHQYISAEHPMANSPNLLIKANLI